MSDKPTDQPNPDERQRPQSGPLTDSDAALGARRLESSDELTPVVDPPRPLSPAMLWLLESRRGEGPSNTRIALLMIALTGAGLGGMIGAFAVGGIGDGNWLDVLFSGFVVGGLVGAALALALGGFFVILFSSTSRRR